MKRREFFAASAALALAPVAAPAVEVQNIPEDWARDELNTKLAYHIEAIREALLEHAPDGVTSMQGIQLRWIDGKPTGVWATGREGLGALQNYRPESGWRQKSAVLLPV
ncbi:hypothetical protein [Pseudooceanicola marinus]|uniref:hypothetical protein n=1 Tax=Pseudooceanicola marinus TaxID=396013 RepID=UPI001CD67647|nr:hypothetical protein [Pseudooceanicola marinus]MCA1338096.1 hypothetical protein [Pseudooceanicola marinus]